MKETSKLMPTKINETRNIEDVIIFTLYIKIIIYQNGYQIDFNTECQVFHSQSFDVLTVLCFFKKKTDIFAC